MRYIKTFLTGTTLVAASTTGIMADPPNGIKLIDNEKIKHPVFGAMKVISHKEDIDFYHQKVEDPNKDPFENEYDEEVLAENFIKYVLNTDSLKQANIPQKDMEKFVVETCKSQAGMATLKVITANYMREYDRIKQFCKKHEGELKECYDFSQTEEGKELYEKERQIFELEEKLKELFDLKTDPHEHSKVKVEISREDLMNLYKHFSKEDSLLKDSGSLLETLKQKDNCGFCITSYPGILTVYKHFQSKQTGNFRIGCWEVRCGSDRYKRLETFYTTRVLFSDFVSSFFCGKRSGILHN